MLIGLCTTASAADFERACHPLAARFEEFGAMSLATLRHERPDESDLHAFLNSESTSENVLVVDVRSLTDAELVAACCGVVVADVPHGALARKLDAAGYVSGWDGIGCWVEPVFNALRSNAA